MSRRITFKSAAEMPPIAVSLEDMGFNRTGGWRYLRPIYEEKLAPCRGACPAGTDLPRVLTLISDGKFIEAYHLIREENPLPGICGRVCYHPCEAACNRGEFDEAVSIRALERFVADVAFDEGGEKPKGKLKADRRKPAAQAAKIAIVGSGPAGLACAYFLAREGFSATIYEAEPEPGGMLRVGIPPYRLPREVLDREIEAIARLGVEFELKCRVGQDMGLEELWERYNAVFVATGAHLSRPLRVEGEDEPGVMAGLEFLKLVNAGHSVELGEQVLVIGGGNTAIDAARTALRLGAKVKIVYRRTKAEMPAHPEEIEEAEGEGIEFLFLAAPTKISPADGVLEVEFIRMELGEADESGRRRPIPIPGSEFSLKATTLLKAIGEEPSLPPVEDESEVVVGNPYPDVLLKRAGVFLGGDAKSGPSTVVEAIASGKENAWEIIRYLHQAQALGGERRLPEEKLAFECINLDYFSPLPRAESPRLPARERVAGFPEVIRTITPEQAISESRRCFSCGVCNACDNCWAFCPDVAISRTDGIYEVNLDYCKGCGICAQECPRGVISLVEEAS
jgi:NADPH-dependent glutamate synthase beta subunit-like oxidoreductase